MTRIRPATPADAERIRAIHVAAVERFAPAAYDDDQVAAWSDWSGVGLPEVDDDGHWVLAERDGETVGFGRVERRDDRTGEVTACYVDPDHARTGVGSTVMAALEGYARGRGRERVALWASRNAVPFYEWLGYGQTGDTKRETTDDGLTLTVVEFAKEL